MKKMSSKLKKRLFDKYGKWVLVTGASSGIGKELTYRLAEAGLNIILVARNKDKLNTIKEDLEDQFDVKTQVIVCDLSRGNFDLIFAACQHKDVGLFVGSAGFGTSGHFIENALPVASNMIEVNCKALMVLSHFFAQIFTNKKRGGMILLSSMVGFQGVPYSANYAATKAYVQSLAEGLYHELKPLGVDVLAAAPGPVKSGFESRANMKMDRYLTPEQIGIPILKALGNQMTVLPGTLTKLLVYSLRTLPRWGKIRVLKMVMGGMTKHQRTN
ncbi:MAG: SDR family NAD(P)-dependent oxidoreductase [Bacteroidota bacterium]